MSARKVECLDCNHQWTSSADDPRCSKAACGRSRNVEPVDDDLDDEPEVSVDEDDDLEDVDDDDLEDDVDDESEGYTPRFKSRTNRVETDDLGSSTDENEHDDAHSTGAEQLPDAHDDAQDDAPDLGDDIPDLEPKDLEPMIEVLFDMAAARRGEHWGLNDGEGARLAAAWTPVANKYAPVVLQEHMAIALAAVTTAAVLRPRVKIDREKAKREKANETDDGATDRSDVEDVVDEIEDVVENQTTNIDPAEPAEGGYAAL